MERSTMKQTRFLAILKLNEKATINDNAEKAINE